MTIRMQESEAAENFREFLAHLEAGDQVELEREGKPPLAISVPHDRTSSPGHVDFILRKQKEFRDEYGPVVVDKDYFEHMRKAREETNQPLELRRSWD